MIRVDRLSQALKDGLADRPNTGLMLLTDDGAPIALSHESEESQTIGAAAASIFLEYKATDKFGFAPLTGFVYSAKNRIVMVRSLAVLGDGVDVLICGYSSDGSTEYLDSLVTKQAANLAYLIPVFAAMTRKVLD